MPRNMLSTAATLLGFDIGYLQDVDYIRLFINAKIVTNSLGETSLHKATKNGNISRVKLLIAAHADVNVTNYYGETPLHLAAKNHDAAMTQQLIASGADRTITRDVDGKTAFVLGMVDAPPWYRVNDAYIKAVEAGRAERREYLARRGAAKILVSLQAPEQLIPHITDIIARYAYGQSPQDLPVEEELFPPSVAEVRRLLEDNLFGNTDRPQPI